MQNTDAMSLSLLYLCTEESWIKRTSPNIRKILGLIAGFIDQRRFLRIKQASQSPVTGL
jgi:hypothetical protein